MLDVFGGAARPQLVQLIHEAVQDSAVVVAKPAGNLEACRRGAFFFQKDLERLDEIVQALFRTNAGKVADRERGRGRHWAARRQSL